MQLSNLQKLRLRHFVLSMDVIRLDMWLTVLYEFDGQITVYTKVLDLIIYEEPKKEITIKQALLFVAKHIYGDFNYKKPYPKRPLLMTHIYTILSTYRVDSLIRYFPIEYRVKSRAHTQKRDYLSDRKTYRFYHSVAKDGHDLKSYCYEEYKQIAQKYKWPVIFNSDETEI